MLNVLVLLLMRHEQTYRNSTILHVGNITVNKASVETVSVLPLTVRRYEGTGTRKYYVNNTELLWLALT